MVDKFVGDVAGHFLLTGPACVERFSQFLQFFPQQAILHAECFMLDIVHGFQRVVFIVFDVFGLFFDNLSGATLLFGVEENGVHGPFLQDIIADAERIDNDFVVFQKLHEVNASEGSGILVLFASCHIQVNAFDFVSVMGNIIFPQW